MERTEPAAIAVCDAGPLIHLDELESLTPDIPQLRRISG